MRKLKTLIMIKRLTGTKKIEKIRMKQVCSTCFYQMWLDNCVLVTAMKNKEYYSLSINGVSHTDNLNHVFSENFIKEVFHALQTLYIDLEKEV